MATPGRFTAMLGFLALACGQAVEARLTRREHADDLRKSAALQEARPERVDALDPDCASAPAGCGQLLAREPELKPLPMLRRQVVAVASGLEEAVAEEAVAEAAPAPVLAPRTRVAPVQNLFDPEETAEALPNAALLQAGAAAGGQAQVASRAASAAQFGPLSFFESLFKPKGMCACALLVAALGFLYVKLQECCGENSCWTRCACWRALRLKAGLDEFDHLDLAVTVHRCRDLPNNNEQLFVGVFPRRSGGSSKPPKLDKGTKTVRTAKTTDHIWEQELSVRVEQGCTSMQIVLYKTARIGKGTMLGWDRIKISDVLKESEGKDKADLPSWAPEASHKHWLTLHGDDGQRLGSLQVTVRLQNPKDGPKRTKPSAGTASSEGETDSIPRSPGTTGDFGSDIDVCSQALSGPLHQADKLGDYQLRWFRLEMKRGVAAWAWYATRDPAPGTKPLGRIPVLSITLVHPVPKSASEFVLRYSNANRRMVDMMLQRHDRPRDAWIGALHKCIEVVRAERQAAANQKRREEAEEEEDQGIPRGASVPAVGASPPPLKPGQATF